MNQLTFSSEERPASPSASPDSVRAWMMRAVTWPSFILAWLTACAPAGWFGRTSPVSCRLTEDGRLEPLLEGWQNSGMGGPTESLTLSTSEFPSAAVACSLSDILETGAVPRRFYLSPKACAGLLRRAARRGKELPPALHHALKAVADSGPTTIATED